MQITLRQAATYLRINEATLQKWIARRRELPVHRINERLLLNAIEVWEWAVARGIPVSRNLLNEARRKPEEVPPLWNLLQTGGVHRDIVGRDKNEILANIVQVLPPAGGSQPRAPPGGHRSARGHGLHGHRGWHRHPPRAQSHPAACGSTAGLPVPAEGSRRLRLDGPACRCTSVFLIISCSIPEHLRILAQLGFALRDPALRELLPPAGRERSAVRSTPESRRPVTGRVA